MYFWLPPDFAPPPCYSYQRRRSTCVLEGLRKQAILPPSSLLHRAKCESGLLPSPRKSLEEWQRHSVLKFLVKRRCRQCKSSMKA